MSSPTFDKTTTQTCDWADLPTALHGLWDDCMQNHGGSDVARALTMNLIGIAHLDDAAALCAITEQLHRHTPCRAFMLLLDENADDEAAEVSATTRRHGEIRDIVLEEIVLRVRTADLPRIPGLLRPLIIDDLPSHLFWALPWPAKERSFDTLAQLCQHAIVDSSSFGNPARELPILSRRREQGQLLSDLSWLRVQPWRRALAEAFERFDWRPNTSVNGTVRHGKAARATAMLLSDWLYERLAASIALEPDGDADSVGPDHVVLHVLLESGEIEIVIDTQDDKLVTHVTAQSHCYMPFRSAAQSGSDAKLLSLAIDAS